MTTTKSTRRRAEAARRSKGDKQPLVSSIDFTQEPASLPTEIWEPLLIPRWTATETKAWANTADTSRADGVTLNLSDLVAKEGAIAIQRLRKWRSVRGAP